MKKLMIISFVITIFFLLDWITGGFVGPEQNNELRKFMSSLGFYGFGFVTLFLWVVERQMKKEGNL